MRMDKNRGMVKREFLEYLEKLEEEGWEILGWQHMHLEKMKWLARPEKLKDCEHYKVMKGWLDQGIVVPLRSDLNSSVQYKGLIGDEKSGSIDSLHFCLWLAKGETVCVVSYGEHKFENEALERASGRAGYSIVFKDWKDVVPKILGAQK